MVADKRLPVEEATVTRMNRLKVTESHDELLNSALDLYEIVTEVRPETTPGELRELLQEQNLHELVERAYDEDTEWTSLDELRESVQDTE